MTSSDVTESMENRLEGAREETGLSSIDETVSDELRSGALTIGCGDSSSKKTCCESPKYSASALDGNLPNGSGESGMIGDSDERRAYVGPPDGSSAGYRPLSSSMARFRARDSSDIPLLTDLAWNIFGGSVEIPLNANRGGDIGVSSSTSCCEAFS